MQSEFLDKYCIAIVIVLCVIALLFIVYGHHNREKVQMTLKREFIKFPESSIDWWSVSHFLLYGIFGFLIPERPLSFFILGSTFELAEDYLSSDATTQLADCNKCVKGDCDIGERKFWCRGYNNDYWYMNATDPWINLTGYIIGSAIRTTL